MTSKRIAAFLAICLLGLSLAGCDKCGDWFGSQPQSCKDDYRR